MVCRLRDLLPEEKAVVGAIPVSIHPDSVTVALFGNHSDPPGREQDPENKTSSDCVDKKAVNSAFKAKGE